MIKKKYGVEDKPLKPLTSTDVPSYFIFFDTETTPKLEGVIETHTFKIGWTCFWDRLTADDEKEYQWKFWDNCDKMCKYIHGKTVKCRKLTLIAHNVYFDLQVSNFFGYMTKKGWKVNFLYDKSSTFILKCTLNDSMLVALSTTNWFDQPLVSLGELVGLPKLEVDFDKCSDEELKVYCQRDVEILTKIVKYYIDFLQEHKLGKFCFSKASQAFTAYRFRFMTAKIRIHHDERVVALERLSYMGGRCEAFRIGKIRGNAFITLDINAMYPFVMKTYSYPTQLVEFVENPSFDKINRCLERFCVIAKVELMTPEPAFAYENNKKTIFPTGNFDACLCSNSLGYALEKGYVRKIYEASIYRRDDLFTDYVDYFHHLRKKYKDEKNDIMALLCKYMHNALYGKWGQKFTLEEREDKQGIHDYYREEILDLRTHRPVIKTWLMNQVIVKYGETEGRNAMVAIVSHITDNARMLLWSIIKDVGLERVLYCDTDSIKIRKNDLMYVKWKIDPSELGALKLEDETKELFIGGAKYYITEKTRKIKGIPRNAGEVEKGVYEFYSWPKMTYHLREGIITGYNRKQIRRRVSLNYNKGIVAPDGKVTPFIFSHPGQLL